MQRTVTIAYGDEILAGMGLSPEEFPNEARFLLAAASYQLGRITQEQAAAWCGMNRCQFLISLARAGLRVSNLRPGDADAEVEFARRG